MWMNIFQKELTDNFHLEELWCIHLEELWCILHQSFFDKINSATYSECFETSVVKHTFLDAWQSF